MATSERTNLTILGAEIVDHSFSLLENGDRLSRPEFERRFDAMPDVKKAERIEGIVCIGSHVGFRSHSKPHYNVINWLGHYESATPGIEGGDNGSIHLDLDNMPQPDVFWLILPEFAGQARISDDDYVEGGPELVVEVASSSVSDNLHAKLDDYRRNGAKEYLVWRVQDRAFDWFVLRDGHYWRIAPEADRTIRSEVFPSLWLEPDALIRGDLAAGFQAVQPGMATPEHADFVARPRKAAAPRDDATGGDRP